MIRALHWLRDWVLHDTLLKLVSLALSVVLFVVVRGDKEAATSAYVKVVYVLPEDRVLVTDPIAEVRVGIRGPWTRVSRLDERDLDAIRVDLSRVTDGTVNFTEDMIKLPVGMRLASITPPSVRVRFEPKVSKLLPVQPILEGQPAPGFRVASMAAHPREVRVVGAKSVVEGMQRARTRPLRISDARELVHEEVGLEPTPPHARWDGAPTVGVDVEVVEELAEKTLRNQPILVAGATKLDTHVEPAAADVVLRGPAEALAAIASSPPSLMIDAQAEDTRPPGVYRKRVTVVGQPSGVAAEVRPESVTLVTRRRREQP